MMTRFRAFGRNVGAPSGRPFIFHFGFEEGGPMKRILMIAAVAGVAALLPQPRPADAQDSNVERCAQAAVEACDELFAGRSLANTVLRGWCYTIATAACAALGVKVR